MKHYKYNINDLDCANCAKKVEETLNKDPRIKNAIVNFNTKKVSFDSEEISLEEVNKIIKSVEPESYASLDVSVKKEYHFYLLVIGILLGGITYFIDNKVVSLILMILSYIILLYRPAINAILMLIRSHTINENMLITISCIGAFLVDKSFEGMMVVSLYTIGKILEEKALNRSRNSIKDLMNIKEDYANRYNGKDYEKVMVDEIGVGDELLIKVGEKVPVDGIVIKGSSTLDTSALMGESDPTIIDKDDKVLSGSINLTEVFYMKATTSFANSTVSKILELVDDATDKKANMETSVSRLSKLYTPIILGLAILVSVMGPIIFNISYSESIYRGLTFLVISCPCAIAISVPLSYWTGIGVSSKNGILIKGSNYLDNLHRLNKIVFDKTGTLTDGSFKVSDIKIVDKNYSRDEVIAILAAGESFSNHPIATSILSLTNKKIDSSKVSDYKETKGKGISYNYGDLKVIVGNSKMCNCKYDTMLHLNIDGKHVASIEIDDGIKDSSLACISELKKANVITYMFTGDKKSQALAIGEKLGIDSIQYEMLPQDKYNSFEKLKASGDVIAFVGDGINDAPTLKRADIGISMGGIGSESSIESSDIVLMNDDLRKIPLAIKISKWTDYIIKQNLIFALSVKIIILILSIFGLTNMWWAVFADTGVTLLTILNTLRIMTKFSQKG